MQFLLIVTKCFQFPSCGSELPQVIMFVTDTYNWCCSRLWLRLKLLQSSSGPLQIKLVSDDLSGASNIRSGGWKRTSWSRSVGFDSEWGFVDAPTAASAVVWRVVICRFFPLLFKDPSAALEQHRQELMSKPAINPESAAHSSIIISLFSRTKENNTSTRAVIM